MNEIGGCPIRKKSSIGALSRAFSLHNIMTISIGQVQREDHRGFPLMRIKHKGLVLDP
jgi:hypothetical protein